MPGTHLEIINDMQRYMKEPSYSSLTAVQSGQWTVGDQSIRANKAYHELLRDAGGLRLSYTDDSVANQAAYALQADFISVIQVIYDGVKLTGSNPTLLADIYDDYTTQTGTPLYWYYGPNQSYIGLAPVPDGATADIIKVEGRSIGTDMVNPDDTAFEDTPVLYNLYSEAIVLGAVLKDLIEENDERHGKFTAAYNKLAAQLMNDLTSPAGETIRFTVNRRVNRR